MAPKENRRKISRPSGKQQQPSEGIYYLVRFPDEWRLLVCRYTDGPELDYVDFWRKKVAFQLAA